MISGVWGHVTNKHFGRNTGNGFLPKYAILRKIALLASSLRIFNWGLERYFTLNGYVVITADGGQAALQKMKEQPDIILLDINMPDMDGLSLCKNIRDFVSCPILFLTANIEDSDKIKGFSVGGDDYIVKPFSVEELGARVAAHLRRENRSKVKTQVLFILSRLSSAV